MFCILTFFTRKTKVGSNFSRFCGWFIILIVVKYQCRSINKIYGTLMKTWRMIGFSFELQKIQNKTHVSFDKMPFYRL